MPLSEPDAPERVKSEGSIVVDAPFEKVSVIGVVIPVGRVKAPFVLETIV